MIMLMILIIGFGIYHIYSNANYERVSNKESELNNQNLTLLERYNYDIDDDYKDEFIELYANITKNESGELMYEDSNMWKLLVRDNDKIYPLYDGPISLGKMKFWVYSSPQDKNTHIAALIDSTNNVSLIDYVFDKKEQSYLKKTLHDIKIENLLFSSTYNER